MIRQFRSEDAPACCSIIRACIESDLSLSLTLRRKMITAETPQSMTERARLFYVAVCEEQNRIAGIAGLDLNEIRLLCVLPDRQRAGIGRALLEHLESMAPSSIFADIFVYSSIQAAEFYKACGFSEKGAFTFDFCSEPLPTIFMSRQQAVGSG